MQQFMNSMTSQYKSVASQLATESIDKKAEQSMFAKLVPGNSQWDAQLSSLLNVYPSYARSFVSSELAGAASIYTKYIPASAIHAGRAAPSETPSNTPMNVFTVSMTPEQVCLTFAHNHASNFLTIST